MPASNTARSSDNRFQSLSPASLSRTEKSSVIKLALAVLSARYRPGRAFTSPEDIEGFLRLKLTGRRNEVFGIVYLDTRHRLIEDRRTVQRHRRRGGRVPARGRAAGP